MIKLFKHQQEALDATCDNNKCAYYLDMGLGKTFVGSEKMKQLGTKVNLVICQKSKVDDWVEHFKEYYSEYAVFDLTDKKQFKIWWYDMPTGINYTDIIGIINYELAFRRPELKQLKDFTLMLDESQLIQNENAKRSKFIMKLDFENLILLSGTPTGGKYEKLWSQLHMLGYKLSKKAFYNMYVNYHYDDNEGFPIMIIDGYKNVERLKKKMRNFGCVFMKSENVFDLPEQTFIDIKVDTTKEYRKFRKDCIAQLDIVDYVGEECGGPEEYHRLVELVGDTTLTKMLYERQLCGQYNKDKLKAFEDLVESTNDRLIVFYNFTAELDAMEHVCDALGREYGQVNGELKDLHAYDQIDDSVTFVQYQAGAMGLNLQKANKIVYFTPPLSSELFEQSKKRIHRIGQEKPCFYYRLVCKNSIEQKIYKTLEMRKDYTEALFEGGE